LDVELFGATMQNQFANTYLAAVAPSDKRTIRMPPDPRASLMGCEWLSVTGGSIFDRRVAELQADGSTIIRDPVTKRAFDPSTGKEMMEVAA
jgi:hypothetical protein